MKNNLALGLVGMVMFPMVFFSGNLNAQNGEKSEKQRHIKVVKVVDGKKSELDTVVATNDVFIWKGDSIGGRPGMPFGPFHSQRNGGPGRFNGGGPGGPMNRPMGPGGFWANRGGRPDSLGMTKDTLMHRMFVGGQMRRPMQERIFMNIERSGPRHSFSPQGGFFRQPDIQNSIDLGDPNIISYSKKNLKGNKEKIEIIRQKPDRKVPHSMGRPGKARRMKAPMPPALQGHRMPMPGMPHMNGENIPAPEEKSNDVK